MDQTMDAKVLNRFRNQYQQEIREVANQVHFDQCELDSLINIYVKLARSLSPNPGLLSRTQLHQMLYEILEMADDFLIERIMLAIEQSTLPYVRIGTFLKCMSLFLRGTLEERCRYCFKVYDILGEGQIRREHVMYLLQKTVFKPTSEEEEEILKDLSDMHMKKMDRDLDGVISYKDYSEAVKLRPTCLETLGRCLPERKAVHVFMRTFTNTYPRY